MGTYEWLSITLICVAGATTPGPSVLVIIYINNSRGIISMRFFSKSVSKSCKISCGIIEPTVLFLNN